ncbi:MAG: response regulator [Planctomycetes bacterium]|nr:response regulator [Planctomycetota bacterium]
MNKKTVLVVDDDPLIRSGLQAMLQVSGYETLEAEDGAEARELIDEHRPDLVVLDMMMPRWGGFAVLEHFQNDPAAPAFIMLTGHEGEKHKAYARQIGVLDYLEKPYPMERLLQKIDQFFQEREPADTGDAPTPSDRAVRVVVVQNQQPIREALQRRIEDEGYVVQTAADGEEADRKVRGGCEVVVLGLSLPGIDGLTLLKNWRQDGIAADILVLTARDSTQDKVHGLSLGADDYLTKPFQMDELLARLRALVRRRRTRDPVLRIDDLEIDSTARTVRRGKRDIVLTPREFDLLELLAQHHGSVVPRSLIRQQLYNDEDGVATSNVVDVYIRMLRTKIDGPFEKKLIRTHRGEGYSLCGDGK